MSKDKPPITALDIVEGRVSVIELFNRETQQSIHVYWNGHVEGLDENWVVKNLLPSRQSLMNFVASLPPIACETSEASGLKQGSPPYSSMSGLQNSTPSGAK
jgi:hypothetical protein